MKLCYAPDGLEILIPEGGVSGICLENPKTMQSFVSNLWKQSNGEEGDIFISDGDKSVHLDKGASVVFNPFSIDVNEKKILTKLMIQLVSISLLQVLEWVSLSQNNIIKLKNLETHKHLLISDVLYTYMVIK